MSSPSSATVAAIAKAARAAADAYEAGEAARPSRSPRLPYGVAAGMLATLVDEGLSIPPADGIQARGDEVPLMAAGWRFLPLPAFRRGRGRLALRPPLDWTAREWLAVPPEATGEKARRFAKKAPALAWAKARMADAAPGGAE